MDRWTIVDDEPCSSGPSHWFVQNGALNQTSNIYKNEFEHIYYMGTQISAGNVEWTDYYFTARISSSDNDGIGMLFRYQDKDNYYRFITVEDESNYGPFKRLQKIANGYVTTLSESTTNIKIPGTFIGKIHVVGDSIYVYEDNALLFAVQDASFQTGKIGLMCYANPNAIFDDIYISEQDTVFEENPESEILVANQKLTIRALTLNIWVNGKICTPAQVADLILSLDLDFAGLQECQADFGNQVAALTDMHMAAGYDCYLFSKTPYTKITELPVIGINAWTNIDGQTVSAYNFHIRWDEEGDRAARTIVDEIMPNDPVPLQIAFGDFNDEHYSTQITILEEHFRYCLADLGWAPSQRVTWPAFGFYGGEGSQTIDLFFCNKASKGRAIEGEILNLSPLLSDHKPVWTTIEFPADKNEIGPQITQVIPCFNAEMIEVWFNQDLDVASAGDINNYQISPLDVGPSIDVVEAIRLKDPRRVRLRTSAHEYGHRYQINASGVTDEFGAASPISVPIKYTTLENLIMNEGAEAGADNWEMSGGFTAVADRENQYPYQGGYFFTGGNLQEFSSATQTIDLSPRADDIDNAMLAAVWNCYFSTGHELLGEIQASRCEPYDEGEMIIDFLDANANILMQASSKRWDTLFWHPYGETTFIPKGTTKARVQLNSYRKIANGQSNDAAFDDVFFALKSLDSPQSLGKNLLANPSAETGDLSGWTISGSLRARAHEDNKARPVSGYYLFSNLGASSAEASQEFDFIDKIDQINDGELAIRWGGYMRDFRGDSDSEIRIEFADQDNKLLNSVSTAEQRVAEWWLYDTETQVPSGTRYIKYIFSLDAVDEEGVYFDFLHLMPIDKLTSSISNFKTVQQFELRQNFPNPFNANTIIEYNCLTPGNIQLVIFNSLGQKIVTLRDEYHKSGHYKLRWDGKDQSGKSVASGVYFYKLKTNQSTEIKKMMLFE
ncbi:T9SS type A sorting domain-containing protein [candidate division KSB1 bacterium]|nr:T9SS type A sorting domain-containing protein [candidate division KSB1 bacterium]